MTEIKIHLWIGSGDKYENPEPPTTKFSLAKTLSQTNLSIKFAEKKILRQRRWCISGTWPVFKCFIYELQLNAMFQMHTLSQYFISGTDTDLSNPLKGLNVSQMYLYWQCWQAVNVAGSYNLFHNKMRLKIDFFMFLLFFAIIVKKFQYVLKLSVPLQELSHKSFFLQKLSPIIQIANIF